MYFDLFDAWELRVIKQVTTGTGIGCKINIPIVVITIISMF